MKMHRLVTGFVCVGGLIFSIVLMPVEVCITALYGFLLGTVFWDVFITGAWRNTAARWREMSDRWKGAFMQERALREEVNHYIETHVRPIYEASKKNAPN